MQLESTLAQFPIAELMKMIISSSVTGVLEVGDGSRVRVFFRDGRPYHAIAGHADSVEAFCMLFTLKDAPFRFEAHQTEEWQTIWQDPHDLIDYAITYAGMWERVQQHVPGYDWVPVLRPSSPNATVLIAEAAWQLLAAVDGHRSVRAVAEQVGQMPLEVAAALCDLIEQGVLRMDPPPSGASFKPRPSQSNGFFSRLMAAQPD